MSEPPTDEPPPPPLEPVPPLSEEALEERRPIFDELFAGLTAEDAKAKSLAERRELEEPKPGLTYCELGLDTVFYLLNKVRSEYGPLYAGRGLFLDLGSGAGKACMAAALLHPFEKVVGVETLQSLTDCALASLAKYQEAPLPEGLAKVEVEFIKADFAADFEARLEPLLERAAVCLAVATGFEEAQLKALELVARKLPDDAILITFTHRIPDSLILDLDRSPAQRTAQALKKALAKRGSELPEGGLVVEPPVNDPRGWTQLHAEELELPWGVATAFFFKRIPRDRPAETPAEEAAAPPPEEP